MVSTSLLSQSRSERREYDGGISHWENPWLHDDFQPPPAQYWTLAEIPQMLSMMLSLPKDGNYTTRDLAKICKEGMDSIGPALKDLERAEYIVRNRLRDVKARSWMWSMASMKRALLQTRASYVWTIRMWLVRLGESHSKQNMPKLLITAKRMDCLSTP